MKTPTIASIDLAPDEKWAGLIFGENGEPDYHLILLPGAAENLTWIKATEWAKDAGGELPTRREQRLLWANLEAEFERDLYWSSTQHAGLSACAWFQTFSDGTQSYSRKGGELRARAVRRVLIERVKP